MPQLVSLPPIRQTDGQIRSLVVTKDIETIIRHRPTTVREDFPNPLGEALITSYLAGGYVSVSLNGDPDRRKPDLERMYNVDEVWLMCFRRQKHNQWRLMGRFAKVDTFVGLSLWRRRELVGVNYERKAFEFQVLWDHIFDGEPYIRGGKHWREYLTGTVKDVDESYPL
jgi:hypothetical protein